MTAILTRIIKMSILITQLISHQWIRSKLEADDDWIYLKLSSPCSAFGYINKSVREKKKSFLELLTLKNVTKFTKYIRNCKERICAKIYTKFSQKEDSKVEFR